MQSFSYSSVHHLIYIIVHKLYVLNLAPKVTLIVLIIEERRIILIQIGSRIQFDLGNCAVDTIEQHDVQVKTKVGAESGTLLGTELDFGNIVALRSLIDDKPVTIGDIVSVNSIPLSKEEVRCRKP